MLEGMMETESSQPQDAAQEYVMSAQKGDTSCAELLSEVENLLKHWGLWGVDLLRLRCCTLGNSL